MQVPALRPSASRWPCLRGPAAATDATAAAGPTTPRIYSPYAGRSFPTRVLWGDQHLHSSWSADAGGAGATLDPEAALRFARGEQVVSSTGQPVRLSRPLDWLVVADHSDGMGIINELSAWQPAIARRTSGAPLVRHDEGRARAGEGRGDGDHRGPVEQQDPRRDEGSRARDDGVAKEHRHHGEVQRARALHCAHRLRVDVECGRRQQSASQRHLPRRQIAGRPGRADDDVRQREPGEALGLDARLGDEDRWPPARDSAQRQPEQRPDVRDDHVRRPATHARVGPHARELRTAGRVLAGEGCQRGASVAVADRRVRGPGNFGIAATWRWCRSSPACSSSNTHAKH